MSNKYQVVCIDDEAEILELYRDALEDTEYSIHCFSSPSEAKDYINQNHNDIVMVFSDFSMPDMDGFEVRKSTIDTTGDVPYAIVTGYYSKEMAVSGMELKIASFVDKPFQYSSLTSLLEKLAPKRIELLEEEKEMVTSFVEESYPMLEEIEGLILALEDDPRDANALNTYFRLLHTIKGTASCVGLQSIPAYAHKYEDLVGSLKSGDQEVNQSVIDVLLIGLDELKDMYAKIQSQEAFEFEIAEKIKVFDRDFSVTIEKKEVKEDKPAQERKVQESSKQDDEKINVLVSVLDSFMELSGELTVLRNMILKSASKIEHKYTGDRDIDVLNDSLEEMHKVSSRLQSEISEMRKISLDSVFRPMKRVVRDATKALGKDIAFDTDGEALRVDTSIGKVLSNALVHLIRNGIDHGIEKPDVREERGKDRQGNLRLSAFEEGENIIVEIVDDGNGMDPNKIKEKALEKELFSEDELNKMSDHRAYSLIFEPGFSTAQEVTDISGRGVGMDMVRSSVEDVGGKILIDSTLGEGSKFVIILPIPRSVLIIKSLMVECMNSYFSISLDDVAEVVSYDPSKNDDKIHEIEGKMILKHHNELIPLVILNDVLKFDTSPVTLTTEMDIVIVRGDGFRYGIVVDKIHDIEEVVVKKMAPQLQKTKSFSGATLVGDGDMALILDLEGIAEICNIQVDKEDDLSSSFFEKEVVESSSNEFMQFDLFTQLNVAIPLKSVDRLEEIACNSVAYSGDIPLVRYRGDFLPIINAEAVLNFSPTSLDEIMSDKSHLDVIVVERDNKKYGIVVSKIRDIGVTESEIFEDISDRSGLDGTVFIGEKTITILSVDYLIDNYKTYRKDNAEVVSFEEKLSA